MKKNVDGIRIGNVVNLSIDGKLYKKNCGSPEEAKELFGLVLKAKADPTPENVRAIRLYLNEKMRIAMVAGLESDLDTGEIYLAGFNTPIPMTLVNVIKDYHENNYPLDAIVNFWKLLMLNPDKRIRTVLFDFIEKHDFVLTTKGYMLVYKAVVYATKQDNDLMEFVTNQYLHVKKDWKCSPNKYVVYRNAEKVLGITKAENADGHDYEILGKLGDLNADLDKLASQTETVYTDKHTRSMAIKLGVPTKLTRKKCDADFRRDCSNGLHVGATKYVEGFANSSDAILVCLVNPANVVAVPDYDHSKMRVCEYFPIALATYTDGKIDIVEQKYFESDYCTFEEQDLADMIAKVQKKEKPIETAKKAEDEQRPMEELMRILESRLIDLR
jgi:hypothetical protein